MKHIYCLLLIFIVLFTSATCRRNKEKLAEQKQTKQERNTVVEANHYFSDKEKTTTYDIDSVEKDKSLIFILKNKQEQKDDKTLTDNPITITLDAGSNAISTCEFKSYNNLCSINKVSVEKMKLKIQCKKLPCELSWEILQPAVQEEDGGHSLEQLVAVNANNNHASLKVICNNAELMQTFGDEVQLYTNSNFKKIGSKHGVVYFLFDNEQKGYYYLRSENQKVKACANATLEHANETIVFNDEKQKHYDFIGPKSSNTYQFKSIPTTDFRVQFSAHDLSFEALTNTTGIKIVLNGYKGSQKKSINNLTLFVDDEKDSIEFNAVYKKPTQKYDKMQFQFHGIGRYLIIQTRFIASDTQQVELGQQSYFSIQKGEKIKYHVNPVALPTDSPIKKVYIFVDDAKKFKLNQSECQLKGCFIQVQALQTGEGSVYIGQAQKQNKTQIIIFPFQKSVNANLRQAEFKYYSTKLKAKHSIQLLINTPNAIAYASSKTKCQTVDEKCYQKIFTYHNPSIYEPIGDDTLQIKVVALENVQFTITVIDQNSQFVQLKDTIPFAYLFDSQQKKMIFMFNSTTKQDVSFNLIAPTNQLDLLVVNTDKPDWKDEEGTNWANDGFIKFEAKDIKQSKFFIQVRKKQAYANKWIHFTIIASSKQTAMQLEAGFAHYQTIKSKDTKDFIFQFEPQKRTMLNFYTHNIKSDVKIHMKVSDTQDYNDGENTAQFTIDKEVDVFDLSLVSKKLCEKQSANCQIFIQLENQMSVEADLTITMMIDDVIIELKDGVWQNYNINYISATSHFYFIPTHQDHSTTIFYKSSFVDMKIMYNLWKTDYKSMNPNHWPFPAEFKQNEKLSQLSFKPLQFIHIQTSKLKECWPNCVVLLSIAPHITEHPTNSTKTPPKAVDNDFKIMASNNFIELPQKHKVDIALVKGQNKAILVDLKYHLDKESVTFYTYNTLGRTILTANVYTQKNPRCPTPGEDSDFNFTSLQTDISVQRIKQKLSQNSMEGDNTPFLCILAVASQDSKISIQFSTDKNAIKTLAIDTTTAVISQKGDKKVFQIQVSQQVYLKIARDEGFPYFDKKICKSDEDISKCVQQFENSDEKGIQLADKVTSLDTPACNKCTLLFKLTSLEPSKADVHVQSKYAEIELAQNKAISDSLLPEQQNRYTLTGTKSEQMVINIQIISGNIKVEVHDFGKVNISKSNTGGAKNIHIVIPPKNMKTSSQQLGTAYMTSFALSSFTHLHLVISSQNPKEQAVYTITYSSGDAISYLQDGLITQYNIVTKKTAKFIYENPGSSKIYVHVTAADVSSLNKLQIKAFAMDDSEDEDGMISMTPEKPDFKKKTPNPTMLMELPAKKTYFLSVTNTNDKDILFTLGVNNRQIIYLPFDHEFPLHLNKGQYIYVVLSNSLAGYIKISFSKCDQSQPFIGYTMEYNDFVNEDFQVQQQMTDQLSQDLILKVKTPGSVYIKLRSPDDDTSLMSIKASFSTNKIKSGKSKPGDKGLVQYQLLDSTKAELTFTTLVCGETDKNCNKDFSYSSLSAAKIEDIYAQLVCSSIMFDLTDSQQLKSAQITAIPPANIKNNKVTFTQAMKGQVEYVGVKATNSKTGQTVYYQPVEIVTFMGQLHRTPTTTFALGGILLLAFACGALIIYRRFKKNREYSNIGQLNDEIE